MFGDWMGENAIILDKDEKGGKSMELEEAIKLLKEMQNRALEATDTLKGNYVDKKAGDKEKAIETVLNELKDRDKEITDMREMIVRVAKNLEKKGKYELSEYILAQIEATPTFTTWEEYITWVPKSKIEDKIKAYEKLIDDIRESERYSHEISLYRHGIQVLQELLEEK